MRTGEIRFAGEIACGGEIPLRGEKNGRIPNESGKDRYMKRNSLLLRTLAVILAVCLAACLAGCAKGDPELLNEKVVKLLDLDAARDTETAYSMLYPGVTDLEAYRTSAEKIYEYFPVSADYTWELLEWNVTKSITNSNEIYDGRYKVTFDGQVFYVYAVWRSDPNGSGFTRCQVVSEADWLANQKK